MNTSNKSLLQILVEYLPHNGGWPEGCHAITQDSDAAINTYNSVDGLEINEYGTWRYLNSWMGYCITAKDAPCLALDYTTAIIVRDQYEAALAASKELRPYQVSTGHYTAATVAGKTASSADADGWISWSGGECPVDSDAIVEVKYRKSNPYQFNNDRAGDFTWSHHGIDGDIIAYRLQQPHEVKTAGIDVQRDAVKSNDAQLEADLNDCIGQAQSNDDARDEILYELANFAATTKTSLDIGVATTIAMWLSAKGYRKQ